MGMLNATMPLTAWPMTLAVCSAGGAFACLMFALGIKSGFRDYEKKSESEYSNKKPSLGVMNLDYKHSCVVDSNKKYKTLVLVLDVQKTGEQETEWQVQHYTLQEGETLVDAAVPTMRPYAGANGLITPKWDEKATKWVEGATLEEIELWEKEHPAPTYPAPTVSDTDILNTLLGV